MKKTPQDFKREEIKKVFKETLKSKSTILRPVSIRVTDAHDDPATFTNFSFQETGKLSKEVLVERSPGKGFIDGLFAGLYGHFASEYPSLRQIKLVDLMVNPSWMSSKTDMRTDAKASVIFRVEVGNHGTASFRNQSRSMIWSSFAAALEAFQFYINCERSFNEIQPIIDDARNRNRFDIVEKWKFKLSKLTEVNTYEKKEREN